MFKILALDGGGIRGIITAYWLDKLQQELEQPLYQYFDLIAGTSTGAILAAAIACDVLSDEENFVDFYRNHGAKIFASRNILGFPWPVPPYLSPEYKLENLESSLKEVFTEGSMLSSAQTNLFITSYDVFARQPFYLKSYDQDTGKIPIWAACLSSAAAPIYFPANVMTIQQAEKILIDGGVVANNPAALALAEATIIQQAPNLADIQSTKPILLISFGTGNLTRRIDKNDAQSWGGIQWVRPIIDVIFDGSSASVDFICRQILGNENYVRLQVELIGVSDDIDNATPENIQKLINLASAYVDGVDGENKFNEIVNLLQN